MPGQPEAQFALVLSLDQPPPPGVGPAPFARKAVEQISPAGLETRLVVLGADGGLMAETFGNGWNFMVSPDWQYGPVPGLRQAMRALPLLDGFFLACSDGTRTLSLTARDEAGTTLQSAMANAYLGGRIKLMRIVVPTVDGGDCWPWLIDIGFRQPFVELREGDQPSAVLAAHHTQVIRLPAEAFAARGAAA